jgi:hypothetical protein
VKPGTTFVYQPTVQPAAGDREYRLEKAPGGMRIDTTTGRITWDVPADAAESDQAVVLSVRDRRGKEAGQTFQVFVTPRHREAGRPAPDR